MTPKEKAKELVYNYSFVKIANYTSMFEVKQCALIAVDEIIKVVGYDYQVKYWEEVKQEIELL